MRSCFRLFACSLAAAALAAVLSPTSPAYATTAVIDVAEDAEITSWPNWANDPRGELPESGCCVYGGNLRVAIGPFPTGAWAGTGNIGQVLMRWDLSSIPANHVVTNATLRMIQFDGAVDVTNVNRVDQGNWTEATVTWNNWTSQSTSSTLLGGMLGTPEAVNGGETLFSTPSLTSTVQGWHDGNISNLGLLLTWGGPNDDGDTYAAREHTTADAPQLILEHHAVPEPNTVAVALAFVAAGTACRRRCLPAI